MQTLFKFYLYERGWVVVKFKFKAKIYKVGINPCVKVPRKVTARLVAAKGYIAVKGKIQNHSFTQTLVPVKGEGYRLYVNGPMMKGADVRVGQMATFQIEQSVGRKKTIPMLNALKERLEENNLTTAFKKLTPSRQKEILKYLGFLKSEEPRERNIEKIIKGLKGEEPSSLFRLP